MIRVLISIGSGIAAFFLIRLIGNSIIQATTTIISKNLDNYKPMPLWMSMSIYLAFTIVITIMAYSLASVRRKK